MLESYLSSVFHDRRRGLAMVLGTNEIASAVAVHLHRAGFGVVLSHDPHPPVIRRAMAFHDALWGEGAELEGIRAELVERACEVLPVAALADRVAVTRLGLVDLMVAGRFAVIVDARMQKYAVKPNLRYLARLTIGVGPGFTAGIDCDLAVETRPAVVGRLLTRGGTDAPDGVPDLLGGVGPERFARAPVAGRWHTAMAIGGRVFRGQVVGHIDRGAVVAPIDGVLRGLARDGVEVYDGVKLLEIDPRNRWQTRWAGIDARGRAIGEAVAMAAWDNLPDLRAEPESESEQEPEPEARPPRRRREATEAIEAPWWLSITDADTRGEK